MEELLFLDVEATGIEKDDRLCQVAYSIGDTSVNEYFRPPVPIKYTAMAVTHITNEMVAEKPPFADSETQKNLQALASAGTILVAHNAPYDLKMLEKDGVVFTRFIDTLKVVKHLDKGSALENHQLQYLRYFYGVNVQVNAHDALGDIIVLKAVFEHLKTQMQVQLGTTDDAAVFTRMVEISTQPSMVLVFQFGKYKGRTVQDIAKLDRGYLEWLLDQKKLSPDGEEDWIYTLKHHLA